MGRTSRRGANRGKPREHSPQIHPSAPAAHRTAKRKIPRRRIPSRDFPIHVELLSRFELETSSLPIMVSGLCRFWQSVKSRMNARFLLCVFCMQAYFAVAFCGHSPQIHPKTKQKRPRVTPSRCSTGAFVVVMVQLFDDGFFAVGQLPHAGGGVGVWDGMFGGGLTGGGMVRDQ